MRDRQLQLEQPKIERSSFADNKSAPVHLPRLVPTQKNRALMRDTKCQIYDLFWPCLNQRLRYNLVTNKNLNLILKKIVLLVLILFPVLAYANTGIPILLYMSAWQVFLLIPIIVIEAIVLHKGTEIRFLHSLLAAFIANIASTIFGFLVSFPTYFIPIMFPWGYGTVILLIILMYPFYLLSIWSEYQVLKLKLRQDTLRNAVVTANRASYLLLVTFLLTILAKSYFMR